MPRTIRLHATGGPEVLRIEDFAAPNPGPGQVRLRIRSIGLNRAEVMFRGGTYLHRPVFPAQLGFEAAGEVESLGEGVTGFSVGDRVAVIPAFPIDEYGLYGEVSLAPARALVHLAPGMVWEDAAAAWMQYGTAWGSLVGVAGLGRGDTVLVRAASSSVGMAAIQIARMVGAVPIALTRRSDKKAALLDAGAAAVVAMEECDLASTIMALTGGEGARVAFDPVGGPTFPRLVEATAVGGTMVVYGALSAEVTPLPMLAVLSRDVTIRGYDFSVAMRDDGRIAAMRRFVSRGLASGALKPRIAKVFPFDRIQDAHRFLEGNTQVGKIVVMP